MTGTRTSAANAREFIQDELDTAALYEVLAAGEASPQMAEVYRRMAASEQRHADHWIAHLKAGGDRVAPHRLSVRTRILIWLARRFGPGMILSIVTGQEISGAERYGGVSDRAPGMDAEERGHARALRAISGDRGAEGPFIARLEGRHRSTAGNALRAAVLGANDGLVSNLSLVMGVAGANVSGRGLVITGVAGLLACAGSMALGEWLSVKSSRELYERQIAIEAAEIESNPAEEAEELALIYQAKGLSEDHAREVAAKLMATEGSALDTLSREELGIDPKELGGSALQAAVTSFLLCAIGAIIPVLPFLFLTGRTALIGALASSTVGLFAIGAGITLLTGRSIWFSGLRQVAVGLGAAGLTFLIGRLIGVSIT